MTNIFSKLQKLIGLNKAPSEKGAASEPPQPSIALTDAVVKNLMRQVDETQEDQYSCEETFALLDEYVELVTSEEDAATLMPLVERHIHHCPDCREHYDTLLTILQTE